ncbi:hypothetical protein NDU88_007276 [Pleurodeles waltl]|uniref:Uncharacterized protein n=1 Tax=Pleurodeles waltl TaxID=8319 RepID=A0AAV7MGH6_PLEWA|nr:hypothetical protein NDU88_007276 [Pleurodeles waltl]
MSAAFHFLGVLREPDRRVPLLPLRHVPGATADNTCDTRQRRACVIPGEASERPQCALLVRKVDITSVYSGSCRGCSAL